MMMVMMMMMMMVMVMVMMMALADSLQNKQAQHHLTWCWPAASWQFASKLQRL